MTKSTQAQIMASIRKDAQKMTKAQLVEAFMRLALKNLQLDQNVSVVSSLVNSVGDVIKNEDPEAAVAQLKYIFGLDEMPSGRVLTPEEVNQERAKFAYYQARVLLDGQSD